MMCEGASSAAATVSKEKIKIHLEDDDYSSAVEQRMENRYVHNTYQCLSILYKHNLTLLLMLGHTTASKTNNPQQGEI